MQNNIMRTSKVHAPMPNNITRTSRVPWLKKVDLVPHCNCTRPHGTILAQSSGTGFGFSILNNTAPIRINRAWEPIGNVRNSWMKYMSIMFGLLGNFCRRKF